MRFRNTLVAAAILLALGAFYYWHEIREAPARQEQEAAAKRFLPLAPDAEVRGVDVRNGAGEIRLEIQEGAGWRLRAPLEAAADEEQVRGLIEALRGLQVVRRPREIPDAAGCGLEPAAAAVTLRPRAGEAISMEIGGRVPVGDGFFARRTGSSEIVVVGGGAERAVSLALDTVRDRRAVRLDSWSVDRLRVERGGSGLALEREADGAWSLKSPIVFPADRETARQMVDDLCGLRAEAFVEGAPAAASLAPPAATVVLAASEGGREERIEIGGPVEGQPRRYLRRADGSVIEVGDAVMQQLDRGVNDFRRREVLGIDRWSVARVEISGAVRRVLEKSPEGGDWRLVDPGTRDLAYDEAAGLLEALYGLKADRFLADPPEPVRRALESPELSVRLESGAEGAVRKDVAVLAGPVDGAVFARVEGVADLFVLPGDALQTVRQAAERLTAAPAPAPAAGTSPAAAP